MRNLKLTLAYDGTDFHGWQIQPGVATVQGTLTEALHKITQDSVALCGAGRTDAGVHAWGQVANFKTISELSPETFGRALNALLPPTIRVRNVEEVSPDFHARWLAHAKTYRYRIYRGAVLSPFVRQYVLHDPHPLDFAAMAEAARYFQGEHDFASFAASTATKRKTKPEPWSAALIARNCCSAARPPAKLPPGISLGKAPRAPKSGST